MARVDKSGYTGWGSRRPDRNLQGPSSYWMELNDGYTEAVSKGGIDLLAVWCTRKRLPCLPCFELRIDFVCCALAAGGVGR
eukprot:m.72372 g.72372  ORF g.72372 m.72372 type:complete len:81 (+) comp35797_c0_seq2:410-652(+)